MDPILLGVIEEALQPFRPRQGVVSVSDICRTVRLHHPEFDLPDVLLKKHIGDLVIRKGFNVHFDTRKHEVSA